MGFKQFAYQKKKRYWTESLYCFTSLLGFIAKHLTHWPPFNVLLSQPFVHISSYCDLELPNYLSETIHIDIIQLFKYRSPNKLFFQLLSYSFSLNCNAFSHTLYIKEKNIPSDVSIILLLVLNLNFQRGLPCGLYFSNIECLLVSVPYISLLIPGTASSEYSKEGHD